MIQKLRWSDDPYEELTKIKSGLNVEYVCTLLASNNQRLLSADEMIDVKAHATALCFA